MKTHKVKNITDLIPLRGANEVKELPRGKPKHRHVWSQGPARVITYIFKTGVYKKISFRGLTHIYELDPLIVHIVPPHLTGVFIK